MRIFGLCLGVFLASSVCQADPVKFAYSDVKFLAVGNPGFIEIEGTRGKLESDTLDISGDTIKGKVKVKLANLTTDMETRDEHMKEKYLEVKKFPYAVLDIAPSSLKSGSFKGTLTLKGETKPVSGDLTVKGKEAQATFKIGIKDYPAIGVPSWLGITVADEVEITVKAKLL